MTNLIEFPGLGISLELSRVAFRIFGINIYWYGIFIGLGLALAVWFAFTQAKRFGIDVDRMVDVIAIGLACGVLGGRLYYVLFDSDHIFTTFWQIFNLRLGGIGIYGGIIGGFIGAVIGCKWRKVPLLPMFDLTAMGFLIGQAVGRWGNFFNQEAFGTNTTLPWGMISPETTAYLQSQQAKLAGYGVQVDPFAPVHPTFLYESLWCALGFLLLFLYRKHRKFNGELFLFYLMWYGVGRLFIEGMRTDPLMVGTLRISQVVSAVAVIGAFAIWIVARVKTAGKPLKVPKIPPHTAKVKLETADGPRMVVIEWPADTKAPTAEERRKMAEEQLAAENGKGGENERAERSGESEEKRNAAKPDESEKNAEAEKKKPSAQSKGSKAEKPKQDVGVNGDKDGKGSLAGKASPDRAGKAGKSGETSETGKSGEEDE